jgi:uncharacterized membrane protein YqhA
MRNIFGMSRYLVYVAVIGLLVAALAVFVFGGITTITTIVGVFQHLEFNAEGARVLSVEFIELMDLFLLGTVLLITSIGLYELFLDPGVSAVIPEWLSVSNLEQLKFNLLAVIIVMLAIFFLGAVAEQIPEGAEILSYGVAISAVLAGIAVVVWVFAPVHRGMEEVKREALLHAAEGRSAEHAPEHH